MSFRNLAVFFALFMSTLAFAQKDFPGAVILTGTVDQFNAACKADLDKARTEITRLKAMKAPRNTMQALQAFDNANLDINFAASRASLAQEVEPDEGMRNASEKCGQDASALSTEISLDRGVYDAIVALDVSKADEGTKYLVKQTLSDFRRSGVDRDQA